MFKSKMVVFLVVSDHLLSPAFVHKKKKKRFQIEILDFNFLLCCLQLTLMLQMKPLAEISLLTA